MNQNMTLEQAIDSSRYALTRIDRPASWDTSYLKLGATVYLRDDDGFRVATIRTTVAEVEPLLKARGRSVHSYR
jgi:hypothetical protein